MLGLVRTLAVETADRCVAHVARDSITHPPFHQFLTFSLLRPPSVPRGVVVNAVAPGWIQTASR